jgi:quinol monooxygenase YgiN
MPSLIATIKVNPDKVDEAKKFFKELAAETLASEDGTLSYTWHQKQGEPETFIVYEKYADAEALKTHSANLAKQGAKFAGLLAGAPEIIAMEEI